MNLVRRHTGREVNSRVAAPQGRPSAPRMLAITAVWGLCFVAISWGLRDAPILWFAALRSGVAGVALVAYGAVRGHRSPRRPRDWALVGALALTNSGIAFAAMFAGVAGLSAGVAAVLANAQPLLILLPAWWLFGERVTGRTAVALAAGFLGLLVVAGPGGGGSGAALSVLAAVAITAGTLLARRAGNLDVVMVSGWHFVLGGIGLALFAWVVEGVPDVSWTPRFGASLAFLALVGTAWAFLAWFREAQRCPLGPLSAWTFLTPVFGVVFAAVLLGELPSGWAAAGLALVLSSLVVALRQRTTAEPSPLVPRVADSESEYPTARRGVEEGDP